MDGAAAGFGSVWLQPASERAGTILVLQKRFSSKSWLAYGISFFAALVVIVAVFAAIGMRG